MCASRSRMMVSSHRFGVNVVASLATIFSARYELPSQRLGSETFQLPSGFGQLHHSGEGEASDEWDGSVASWTHPRIHPILRRLTRKYRCLGGIPCTVKLLKVKVRCRLTRKRSLVRIQSCSKNRSAATLRTGWRR